MYRIMVFSNKKFSFEQKKDTIAESISYVGNFLRNVNSLESLKSAYLYPVFFRITGLIYYKRLCIEVFRTTFIIIKETKGDIDMNIVRHLIEKEMNK